MGYSWRAGVLAQVVATSLQVSVSQLSLILAGTAGAGIAASTVSVRVAEPLTVRVVLAVVAVWSGTS